MMVRYDDGISFYCNMCLLCSGASSAMLQEFHGQSEDSGDHFACISITEKVRKETSEKQRLWGRVGWCLTRPQEEDSGHTVSSVFCFVLFFCQSYFFSPERLHEVGCKQSFHSVLILSLVIISVWCFFLVRVVGGLGGVELVAISRFTSSQGPRMLLCFDGDWKKVFSDVALER